ncbi:hypothetical protein NEPAR04_2358 [Nematocida parisii]|nr:hypothetical protein NEPAR08_2321 [Nematocida parisii]KAI5131177.1 hypothetical protein NEPAR03_2324 [Nematocida parisii]KAI5145164.1 hypothetical protein NEPAR04_2358 [Nematocida parisii]
MKTETAQSNGQNIAVAQEKERKKRDFGLPTGIVEHFAEKGVTREELAELEIDSILEQTGDLDGKAMNKAVQTVLKTTRNMEQLRTRLEMLTGRKSDEDTYISVVNSVLYAHKHTLYTGDREALLGYAYTLATEAEHANVKHIGRVLLAHLPIEDGVLVPFIEEKMASFFPDTEDLVPGQEERMEQHVALFAGTRQSKKNLYNYISVRADTLCVLAKRAVSPLPVWKQVLFIYKRAHKETIPAEKVRALGLAVLKTLRIEKDLVAASSQYVQNMRIVTHDFVYAQAILSALLALPETEETAHAIEKLCIYALTEKRCTVHSLRGMGIAKMPRKLLFSMLKKVRSEKINLYAFAPVAKQLVRELKQSPEDLAALEKYIAGVLGAKTHIGLRDTLKNIIKITHPEKLQKKQREPKKSSESAGDATTAQGITSIEEENKQ